MTEAAWTGIVDSLRSQIGIRGAYIYDPEGVPQASAVSDASPAIDQDLSGRALARTLAGLITQRRGKLIDLDLIFGDGRVLLRTFEGGFLAILSDRQVNLPLLNMSIEEAVQRLRRPAGASSGWTTGSMAVDEAQVLINIAQQELGEHASKVIELLEAARGSQEALSAAIDRAENITRLFINRQKAEEMARKMRSALFSPKV
jgi:predicted regulator of Ras-like GTPase activity (Roadblock/LC7/MglB family)